jgi:hypothetical protein
MQPMLMPGIADARRDELQRAARRDRLAAAARRVARARRAG